VRFLEPTHVVFVLVVRVMLLDMPLGGVIWSARD
jgi:hypothetical protein